MPSAIPTAGYSSRKEAVAAMDRDGLSVDEIMARTGLDRESVIKLRSLARNGDVGRTAESGALYTRRGAMAMADRLKAYWRERGYAIEVEVVHGPREPRLQQARFDVRSNLVNGIPPPSARLPQPDEQAQRNTR